MHSSPLLDLVCSQPEVATGILRWLCHWPSTAAGCDDTLGVQVEDDAPQSDACISVSDTARSIFALRATCTALSQWEDSLQLVALLTGRQRPGAFRSTGGFAYTYPSIVDAIDASHGPRVPEDFDTIAAAIRAADTPSGWRTRRAAISLNAGIYTLTEPIVIQDHLRLVGRCASGAAVLQFQDSAGLTSAAIGGEVRNITIRSASRQRVQDEAATTMPARGLHSICIHGGDLLVRDCTITAGDGHGVLIGFRSSSMFDAREHACAMRTSSGGQMPRLVRCYVDGGTVAGVCIECTSAKLIDCTIGGLELTYSTPGTSIHCCTLYGTSNNAVMCRDQAHATLMHCHISGGQECVRVCDSSDVSLLECEIHDGVKAGVSAEGGGTEVRVEGGSVSGSGNTRVAVSGDALVWMDGKLFATSLYEDRPQPRQPGGQASRSHPQDSAPPADDEQKVTKLLAKRDGGRMQHQQMSRRHQVHISMVVVHREERRVSESLWSRWPLLKLILVLAAIFLSLKGVRKRAAIALRKRAVEQGGQPRRFLWVQSVLEAVQSTVSQKRLLY